jgi:hypothetical protein
MNDDLTFWIDWNDLSSGYTRMEIADVAAKNADLRSCRRTYRFYRVI